MFFKDRYIDFVINAPIAIAFLVSQALIWWITRKDPPRTSKYKLLALIGVMYPLGEALQTIRIVPSWIRWHLSDFGFVPLYSFVLITFTLDTKWEDKARYGIWVIFFLTIGQEVFDILLQSKNSDKRGDPIDLMVIIFSFVITLWVAKREKTANQVP
ncbi:MAG: hypothetical protein RLY57_598 [Candidatus Parcubacteria bacterium]|jgi:hypothetical protein